MQNPSNEATSAHPLAHLCRFIFHQSVILHIGPWNLVSSGKGMRIIAWNFVPDIVRKNVIDDENKRKISFQWQIPNSEVLIHTADLKENALKEHAITLFMQNL